MSHQNKNMAAVLHEMGSPLKLEERPTPTPGDGEILVRNHAIAINPVDWKRQAWGFAISSYPVILGSDVSGTVISVGASVNAFKPGDRVFGFGGSFASVASGNNDQAAFQVYTMLPAEGTSKLPESLTFEQGAILPLAAITSTIALFENLGFQLPPGEVKTVQDKSLLVWGGASSVGSILIQFATFLGFTVYTTASLVHHEYLKGLGATEVFDYRSPSTVENLVSAANRAGKPIAYAVDTVSEADTLKLALEVLEQSGGKGSKLAFVTVWPEDQVKPEGFDVSHVTGESIRGDRKDLCVWLFGEFLPKALEEGSIVPSPKIKVVDSGLGSLQAALDLLKAGGVHGEKLVVKLD